MEFRKFWIGQTVSLIGNSITLFALPTLAVLMLHATPLQIGTLSALATLPFPLFGLFVGVWADRLPRRIIMLIADAVRALALLSIPLVAAFGHLQLGQLYAVALITGIGSAFFEITYQAYLPILVPRENLADANAKLEFSNSGAHITGNALAGGLIQFFGAPIAIAVDAFSYLASIASLAAIRTKEPAHSGPPLSPRQFLLELTEGVRVVTRSPDLRWLAGATGTTNLGAAIAGSVTLIYAYRLLHLQPGTLGLVFGLAELGFVGALLSQRVRRWLGLRRTLIVSLLLAAVGGSFMLLGMLGAPYVFIFLSSVFISVFVPIYNINQISYRQALVEHRLQGRMNATLRTFVWGTLPLGSLVGGYLGNLIGVPATIALGFAISALAVCWLIGFRERALPIVPRGISVN